MNIIKAVVIKRQDHADRQVQRVSLFERTKEGGFNSLLFDV